MTKVKIKCYHCANSDRDCPHCQGTRALIVSGEVVRCCEYQRCVLDLMPGSLFFCEEHEKNYQEWVATTKAEPLGDRTAYRFLADRGQP